MSAHLNRQSVLLFYPIIYLVLNVEISIEVFEIDLLL